MNKKLVLVLAAVLLLAAACNKKATVETNTQSQVNTQDQAGTQSLSASNNTSLKGLITAGKSVTCTFSDEGKTGTVLAANGKSRTDITTTSNNQTITAHTIMDGQTSYTWLDGQSTGFKSTLSASANSSASANTSQRVDPDKTMNYNCSPWTVDNTKFAIPANIQFVEMGSLKIPGQ